MVSRFRSFTSSYIDLSLFATGQATLLGAINPGNGWHFSKIRTECIELGLSVFGRCRVSGDDLSPKNVLPRQFSGIKNDVYRQFTDLKRTLARW